MKARRFLLGLSLGAVLMLGMATLAVLIDPSAALGTRWPNKPQLCTPGLRADQWRSLPTLIANVRPSEVFLGSSRVRTAFARDHVEAMLPTISMNLGLAGAQPVEIERLFVLAAATGSLRRAWVGVDFGMFLTQPELYPTLEVSDSIMHSLALTLRRDSLQATLVALMQSEQCEHPPRDARGFEVESVQLEWLRRLGWINVVAWSRAHFDTLFRRAATSAAGQSSEFEETQWLALERIQRRADAAGVQLVLFVNPSHRYYHDAIEQAGLENTRERWRRRLAEFAARASVPLFDWSDYPPTLELDLEHCDPTGDPACPLYDVNHARPQVGRALLEAMLAPSP